MRQRLCAPGLACVPPRFLLSRDPGPLWLGGPHRRPLLSLPWMRGGGPVGCAVVRVSVGGSTAVSGSACWVHPAFLG